MGHQYTDSERAEEFAAVERRSRQRAPVGDRALCEAVGGDAYLDSMGYVREGVRPVPRDPDAAFGNRLQSEHQTVKEWVKTDEGRQAIADEAERRKPKARLWEGRDGKWHFQTRAGDTITYGAKQPLIEALIFGGRTNEEVSAEMTKFLTSHPDYIRDPHVWSLLSEQLAMEEKFVTAENLAEAWKILKPQIDEKAVQVASRVLDEIESAGERQRYFDELSFGQADEALRAVAKARKEGLI